MHWPIILAALAAVLTVAQQDRPYSCINNNDICQNICYWQTCAHPEDDGVFTRDSDGPVATRRKDCGADHTPSPCPAPPTGVGLGGSDRTSPDEFPFASLMEGGRTPYGDGASILCVNIAEQQSQAGKVANLYRTVANGGTLRLMLQDTAGIPYCDTSLNTPCDGTQFGGYHYFNDVDIYCQWNVQASRQIVCKQGRDGLEVPPPAGAKRAMMERHAMPANHSALLHVREPDRQFQIYNEERALRLKQMKKREAAGYPHMPMPS